MNAKDARTALREHKRQMRANGIKITSPFNGGMDRETQRQNEIRFALTNEVEQAIRREAANTKA